MTSRDLVDLPLEDALEEMVRRRLDWVGSDPLVDAHIAALEGIRHCRESARLGCQVYAAARAFTAAALVLRGAIRKIEAAS